MFGYRAVGNRCAVILGALNLSISSAEALDILFAKGFRVLDVDLVTLARERIGISDYCRGARPDEAPAIVDCSGFIKWLFAQGGIWLPRLSIQQYEYKLGQIVGLPERISANDLVFTSGRVNYYRDNPRWGIGHVGIATGEGTVVHAANSEKGVIEAPLETFMGKKFRGVRRYIPDDAKVLTLEIPTDTLVETSDNIRWIVLRSLSKNKGGTRVRH